MRVIIIALSLGDLMKCFYPLVDPQRSPLTFNSLQPPDQPTHDGAPCFNRASCEEYKYRQAEVKAYAKLLLVSGAPLESSSDAKPSSLLKAKVKSSNSVTMPVVNLIPFFECS
jgi:hypothetical protein